MKRPRADVVVSRCARTNQHYGMRVEEQSALWVVTWAFPMSPSSAARQRQQGAAIEGGISCAGSFPGCPHCGAQGFVRCGGCEAITCSANPAPGAEFRCAWCGNEGLIAEEPINSLQGRGDL